MRKIMIIRHGATPLNHSDEAKDRLRGWMDLPLSAGGYQEARNLAMTLKEVPSLLLFSDLARARQTAEVISSYYGIPLMPSSSDFRPWNIGAWAGKPAAEFAPTIAAYADVRPLEPLPGGECFDAFRKRFLSGLLKALQTYEGLIAIVTHHRCERLLKAWAKAGFPLDASIDQDEFAKRGCHTATAEIMEIPQDRLAAVFNIEYTPRFGDGREEMWDGYRP